MNKIEKVGESEKTHKIIINFIKESPLSQKEIYKKLNGIVSLQAISKHLERGIRTGSLIYFGNSVNKKDAKWILREYFRIKWPTNAWRCYIYSPNNEKFYKRLKSKTKDVKIIEELISLYRLIEFSEICQKLLFENYFVVKKDLNSRGLRLTDEEIKEKINKRRGEVKEFYRNRNKANPTLKFLQFTPYMYRCAFYRHIPIGVPEYDASKDLVLIKDKLIKKLNSIIEPT